MSTTSFVVKVVDMTTIKKFGRTKIGVPTGNPQKNKVNRFGVCALGRILICSAYLKFNICHC